MRTNTLRDVFILLAAMVLFTFSGISQSEATLRAIFYHNAAYIDESPKLPVRLDGAVPVPGHPWLESRIFTVAPEDPPPSVNPMIEVITSIPPSYLFRPPGRIIPSPFEETRFTFRPTHREGFYSYSARWPRLFTPRDGRNTVVMTLVNRGRSLLFNTNFDLLYSIDQEIIEKPSMTQTMSVQLKPLKANLSIIVRLRCQSTEEMIVEMLGDKADPPAASHTSESVIWNVSNPPVGETLTFTVPAAVKNVSYPLRVWHVSGLLITASQPPKTLGSQSGTHVEFPNEFLPAEIDRVRYSISKKVTWRFEYADRTLVDIREIAELVPSK